MRLTEVPLRELAPRQRCQVWLYDLRTRQNHLLYETGWLLLEAPNWTLDGSALILNGAGALWRLPLDGHPITRIPIDGVPAINNDHVLDPDGEHVVLSAFDWQLYRAPLAGGDAQRITSADRADGLMHFLHGISPDGGRLAFVGLRIDEAADVFTVRSSEIYTVGADGDGYRQVTSDGVPADGPEYSQDGAWLYFNTEAFSGHAQVARMRPDGSDRQRLTHGETVDWFPHLAPSGQHAVYLAYPSGTSGHPADRWVELMVVAGDDWTRAARAARIPGGQGTINVNSWAPDGAQFAYVAYPIEADG